MFGNTTNSNLSEQTIQNLNNQIALGNIGGIVFISISMIVGIPGNVIVIYIYLRKYQPSTHRTFIVCLAILDLASCCLSMPFFITVLRYPIEFFSNDVVCKIFHFLTYCLIIGSGFVLVTIAAERHRKICTPHGKQLSEKMSKYVCIIDLLLAGLLSWPGAVLYGNNKYIVGRRGPEGIQCTVSDDFAGTKYPSYFSFVLLFLFIISIIPIFIMYTLIGKQLWKMNKRSYRKNQATAISEVPCSTVTYNAAATQSSEDKDTNLKKNSISILSSECKGDNEIISDDTQQYNNTKNTKDGKGNKKNRERNKTIAFTRIFFIITVVLIISFCPHWGLRFADFINKDFLANLSFAEIVAYQTFRWSFFINSIANPIIYGLYDRTFKHEVHIMFGRANNYP
ncbi:hypothetical protein ACJMK2_013130 [Sinanodonta woodiana]|uniref:G-protein coupled receptors family 1 profile domain-containing protein n=1 Tax=Sinanodonta woodiana TaxID=1069815 RepID=A0ABD3VB70_SINWO